MKKLSLFASISAALVCAAVPASFNWSPASLTLFSLDTAEAKVGRPLTATSVAGVNRRVHRREYRRAATGAAGADVGVTVPAPTERLSMALDALVAGRTKNLNDISSLAQLYIPTLNTAAPAVMHHL
jgi:hypothetical protein